jgi:predicted dehydrogenase
MAGIKFALIGCGAIAEYFYIPVLSRDHSICSELHLVDPNPDRLEDLGRRFRVTSAGASFDPVLDRIDAAIIATPPDTHFPLAARLLAAGRHVLCEKPFTVLPEDAEALVAQADAAGLVLATNNFRRGLATFERVAEIAHAGELGRLRSIAWAEGVKFNWPTKSGFYFTQTGQGGLPPPGVLLDIGSHVVDLVCWWCGGAPRVVECRTDSFGGPEARARIVLDCGGTEARIDLSYYQRMSNSYRLDFERGAISGVANEGYRFRIARDGAAPVTAQFPDGRIGTVELAARILARFVAATRGQGQPLVTGRDVVPSIRAIAQGYRIAEPFDAPWLPGDMLCEARA